MIRIKFQYGYTCTCKKLYLLSVCTELHKHVHCTSEVCRLPTHIYCT